MQSATISLQPQIFQDYAFKTASPRHANLLNLDLVKQQIFWDINST